MYLFLENVFGKHKIINRKDSNVIFEQWLFLERWTGEEGLMELESMLLILCSLFEISAGSICEFHSKSQRKDKMEKKYTQNIILRSVGFMVFSLMSRSTNRKNGREYLEAERAPTDQAG